MSGWDRERAHLNNLSRALLRLHKALFGRGGAVL